MAAKKRKRGPGRPVGDDIVRPTLEATLKQLGERGFSALNVEEVARAAGVNKTSVYRRWPTKAELVLVAVSSARENEPEASETGELRPDLIRLLQTKVALTGTPRGRRIARALITLEEEGDAASLAEALRDDRHALSKAIIQRAVDNGELPPDTDPLFLSQLLLGPVVYRTVVLGEPIEPGYVERLVDQVLQGAGARPARRAAAPKVSGARLAAR